MRILQLLKLMFNLISLKGTFEEAQKLCSSISIRSLSVEYDDKDSCVSKLVGSRNFFNLPH